MKTIYKNINVLDGTKDMVLKENQMITVENGRITAIEENKDTTADKIVDCGGRYLIPGLINLHVHTPGTGFPKKKAQDSRKTAKLVMSNALTQQIGILLCKSAVKTEVLSGTTTIRTVGGLGHIDSLIRDQVKAGKATGPRILSCDQAVTIPGGHMEGSVAFGASNNNEFVQFIEDNAKSGVDWIKIMITGGVLDAKKRGEPGEVKMTDEQVKICCDTAHKLGLKVCAHVESPAGVVVAIKNGVDSIEHGSDMTEETIKLFKEKNAVMVCTLSPAIPLAKFSTDLTKMPEIAVYNSQVLLDSIIAGSKKALEEGITVGLGTDTVCPFITHYDMWRELEYYHRLVGVSRNEALHTATEINASILGLEKETGTIEVGKSADFIVVDKNPLDGFDTIRQPYLVHCMDKEYFQPKIKKNDVCEQQLDGVLASM